MFIQTSLCITTTMAITTTRDKTLLRAHIVQLAVLANHQNGKDSHFRQVRIYTPTG
jgi:hypothetical protein